QNHVRSPREADTLLSLLLLLLSYMLTVPVSAQYPLTSTLLQLMRTPSVVTSQLPLKGVCAFLETKNGINRDPRKTSKCDNSTSQTENIYSLQFLYLDASISREKHAVGFASNRVQYLTW
ncbi:unnamed protein product, partial [Ectocarpus sp. 4 AP-2014]